MLYGAGCHIFLAYCHIFESCDVGNSIVVLCFVVCTIEVLSRNMQYVEVKFILCILLSNIIPLVMQRNLLNIKSP